MGAEVADKKEKKEKKNKQTNKQNEKKITIQYNYTYNCKKKQTVRELAVRELRKWWQLQESWELR